MKAGVKFSFRVNFENLLPEELGALLFVLDILAANEKTRIKIGMGKPLGMGAVKINPKLFVKDTSTRYASLFGKDTWVGGFEKNDAKSQNALSEFLSRMKDELNAELTKTKRITALLTLLQWLGVKPDFDGKPTRYMEIKHPVPQPVDKRGKHNEYRDRPVLPTPKTVFGVGNKIKK